jgi:copper chaperone CopZ
MKLILLPSLLFLLIACNQTAAPSQVKHTRAMVCKTVVPNTIISLGVKGMVCQMGCGGSIRKALKATCAVERVEVNYLDSLEEQTIKVHYDRQKIAPKQMLQILSQINDHQFSVRTIGEAQKLR